MSHFKYGTLVGGVTTTATAGGTTTLINTSKQYQQFTGTNTQTVVLPDATTMVPGMSFYLTNRSSLSITIQFDDTTVAKTIAPDSQSTLVLIDNGTSNGTWDIESINLSSVPAGVLIPFAGTVAPTGFLLCDGSSLNRVTYATLFAAIGTAWGAPDGSTFNIPDSRGRGLRGVDNGVGRDPDAGSRTANASGGNTGDNVGTVQNDAFQGHFHEFFHDNTANGTAATGRNTRNAATDFGANHVQDPKNGNHGTVRVSTETRMKNFNTEFIIKY